MNKKSIESHKKMMEYLLNGHTLINKQGKKIALCDCNDMVCFVDIDNNRALDTLLVFEPQTWYVFHDHLEAINSLKDLQRYRPIDSKFEILYSHRAYHLSTIDYPNSIPIYKKTFIRLNDLLKELEVYK